MRLAFTGGGTGGHVFPNIAVIEKLRETRSEAKAARAPRDAAGAKDAEREITTKPEYLLSNTSGDLLFRSEASVSLLRRDNPEVFYIGEKGGMEERICREADVPFYGIHAGKLRRYADFKNVIDFFKVPVSIVEAFFTLRRLRPDLLFAKGGYVSVPVVLAARVLGIPVWIHESDATPGLSTKICFRFAERIFCAFEETAMSFPRKRESIEVVGNPIRKEILRGKSAEGFRLTGFSKTKPVILVMGGSIGAQSLNKMILKILPGLMKKAQVIHIIGRDQGSGIRDQVLEKSAAKSHPELVSGSDNYKTFKFLEAEPLSHIYAISDLVISRSGSGSIFELLALKKPMFLVPLPRSASRGDQIENAEIFARRGWAHLVDQEKISPKEFLVRILELLENKNMRKTMSEQQKKAHFEDAAGKIAKTMLENRLF